MLQRQGLRIGIVVLPAVDRGVGDGDGGGELLLRQAHGRARFLDPLYHVLSRHSSGIFLMRCGSARVESRTTIISL